MSTSFIWYSFFSDATKRDSCLWLEANWPPFICQETCLLLCGCILRPQPICKVCTQSCNLQIPGSAFWVVCHFSNPHQMFWGSVSSPQRQRYSCHLDQASAERKRQCNCCWICHTIWISQWPFSKACYPDSVVVRNVGSKYAHLSATYICEDTECHVSCQPRLFSVGMLIGLPKDFSFLISLLFFLPLSLLSIRMFQCWTVSHYRLPKLAYWLFTLGGSPGCWARSLQLERCLFPRSCPQTPPQGDGAAFPVLCWFIQDVYLFDHLFVC